MSFLTTIRSQTLASFAFLILLMVLACGVSVLHATRAGTTLASVEQSAGIAQLAGEFERHISTMASSMSSYAEGGRTKDLDAYRKALEQARETLEGLRSIASADARAELD